LILNETKQSGGDNVKLPSCHLYTPLTSQLEFHSLKNRFRGFSGPVGSGKSAALCFEAVRRLHVNRGRQGMLAAPTFAMLRDASIVSLVEMMEDQELEYDHKRSDGELHFVSTESYALLRSLDEPERLRGTNLAWFGIDEMSYASESAWMRLEARLRDPKAAALCGFGVWTPRGHDWLYEKFIKTPVDGYGCIRARAFENRFLLEQTPDYYERLESSYDPKFYSQEALGEYVNSRADRVYHCFQSPVHVVEAKYEAHLPLLWGLDFNVMPMSSVVLQKKGERLVVIDEIVLERATTADACEEFRNRYGGHSGLLEVFGDASGHSSHSTGPSDYAILQSSLTRNGFRRLSMRVPKANPAVLDRVRKVNALMTNAMGEVRLEISPKCRQLIKDFEEVMYKPDSGVIDKLRDPLRTHASDALGYVIWELYGEKPKAGYRCDRIL
jgi:hypothetical protein